MAQITWREHAAPIINQVIEETRGKPMKEIRAALRAAYPYGERAMHPYKIWCSEVRKQLKIAARGKPEKQITLWSDANREP